MDNAAKSVLFIVNPVAGRRLGVKSSDSLGARLLKEGFDVNIIETKCAGDATRIAREHCLSYDVIACTGGDGTLHEVVNGLMAHEQRPPLMYFPSGTMNVVAHNLGITGLPKAAAAKVLAGHPTPYDIGHFSSADGSLSRYFTFIATFGAFSSVSYSTSQGLKNTLGYFAYFLQGIKNLSELKSYNVNIRCNENNVSESVIFGAVTNSRSAGGVLRINSDNLRMDDGIFEVLFIKTPKNPFELERIIAMLLSGQYNDNYIRFYQTSNIAVSCENEIEWCLDGERGGAIKGAVVEVKSAALRIFC